MKAVIVAENLSKRFETRPDLAGRLAGLLGSAEPREVHAVTDVSLTLHEGEVLGLVGESGCGKSTLGRMIAGILEPSAGRVSWRGKPYTKDGAPTLRVQMIFQDPLASLNPSMRVKDIVGEAPRYHGLVARSSLDAHVAETMRRVGLDPVYRTRFPHQFSGGQRQRIGIARALAVNPEVIVCDEPVAALDVSVQAQVLNLFLELRQSFGLAYLFISHNLGVIEHIADRVAIMYLGRIVELAPVEDIFAEPNHPYTQALLASVPRLDEEGEFRPIAGDVPSPIDPPPGCRFHPRCPHAMPRCRADVPALKEIAPGRLSACHLNE